MSDVQSNLEKIYRRHYLTVYRLALAKCGGNPENAGDVFGEVFFQLLKYLRKGNIFNDENHEKAWLIRVTVNCSKVIFRTYGKPSEDISAAERLCIIKPEENGEVFEAVMRLSEKYRVVIHLFYFEDYSIKEIGKTLGLKENTLKSRLSRARELLKRDLEAGRRSVFSAERKGADYEFKKL